MLPSHRAHARFREVMRAPSGRSRARGGAPTREYNIGTKLVAADKRERLCLAIVVALRVKDGVNEVKIHYIGYKKHEDEWVPTTSSRLEKPGDLSRAPVKPARRWTSTVGRADEGVYEVERLLKKRQLNGKLKYLVKWRGYDESYNSWEPPRNIEDSLLRAFDGPAKSTRPIPEGRTVGPGFRTARSRKSVKRQIL